MLMSQSAFAKKLGRSRQYINKLVHKGIIPVYEGKKVDLVEAERNMKEHEDPSRDAQREANEEKRNQTLFEVAGSYRSVADATPEERDIELQEKREELRRLQEEAKRLGVESDEEELDKLSIKDLNAAILRQDLRIKTVKADESEKSVISVEKVNQSVFAAARIVRDGLLSIPSRVAARLAAESDPHTCRTMLEVEITRQLANLTEVFRESESSI